MEMELETETITDEMAKKMIADGDISFVAKNLHRANGLSSEVAHKLIVAGYSFAMANHTNAFTALCATE